MRTLLMLVAVTLLALVTAPAPAAPSPDAHGGAAAADHGGAHGEGHGDGHGEKAVSPIPTVKEGLGPAVTALVVFSVVVFILSTGVWPKIAAGLNDRNSKIREEIEAAEAARRQAKDALTQYQESLAEARAESQKMLEQTRAEQAKLASELKAKADRDLEQLRDRAMRDIEQAKRAALSEIYAESVSLATSVAGKILQREVTAQDTDRMVEESLAELQASRQN